jgi:hypothetical protein
MTPFERELQRLGNLCKDHYRREAEAGKIANESPAQKLARERQFKKDLQHLENERRLVQALGSVQARLEAYRQGGKKKVGETRAESSSRRAWMLKEDHHPADVLADNLRMDGRPKPSSKHAPHHIVPGRGKTHFSNDVRVAMHLMEIRISDPDNGVWLVHYPKNTPHWSMPAAKAHLSIHTYNYERWIHDRLIGLPGEMIFRSMLFQIRSMLEEGNQPPEVTMPPIKD